MFFSTVSVTRTLGGAFLVAVVFLGGMRCDLAEPVEERSLVVEAFLKTGEELPTVTLRRTQPMGEAGDDASRAARGATVTLSFDDSTLGRIPYEAVDGAPGQYAPVDRGKRVPEGVSWELNVEWQGETAQAKGTTPPPIQVSEVCVEVPEEPVRAVLVDSLRRDSLDIPAEQEYIFPIDVTVNWSADGLAPGADSTYWVRAQLPTTAFSSEFIGLFLRSTEVRREDRFAPGGSEDRRQWRGVYAVPVDSSAENDQLFPSHRMTVALTRGDTAFTAFAQSRTDPERREPISNVDGGLGIATAVAVDTAAVDSVGPNGTYCHRPLRENRAVLEEP